MAIYLLSKDFQNPVVPVPYHHLSKQGFKDQDLIKLLENLTLIGSFFLLEFQ